MRRTTSRSRNGRAATSQAEASDEATIADEPERGPLRRCMVTREQGSRTDMIRFVLSPDRTVTPDLGARLPGRGMWLSARRDVLSKACTKGAFARAARGVVTVPPSLLAELIAALEGRIADHIGLARRAGQAVSGFDKAREWLIRPGIAKAGIAKAGLIVQARDGSPDERTRFARSAPDVPVIAPLTGERLGLVFGRDHVVHVAIASGRLAEGLRADAQRLDGLIG